MYLLLDLSRPFTEPVLIFAVAMAVILVAPLVFQRLRIPGIVGLILAGMMIGPSGLNILARDSTIELLGTVGLLYLMFLAGLEINLNQFTRHLHRSIGFGAMTFVFPFVLGTAMAYYLLDFGTASAILLGSMFASHTLVTYPIASRLGLSKTTFSTTAVGGTILTDVAALLVLAIVVASTRGALDAAFWIQLVVALAAFVAIVFFGIPRLGRWFFKYVSSDGAAQFVFVIATVFVAAVLAELAGIEAIIGAFLAGLSLNRLVPEHGTLMNRIAFVGESLFIPFFLLSVGMLIDLSVLTAGFDAWIVAGLMVACVMLGKFLAAQTIRPVFGHSADEANFVFGLTVPQAAATLAVALIGYEVGLFNTVILNGAIMTILVTCIVGPYVTDHWGRRLVLAAETGQNEEEEVPERILVPLANPATADTLMDLAFFIREGGVDQPVFPLTVVNESDPDGVLKGEKLVTHAVVHAAGADVPVVPMTRVDNDVVSGIQRAIRERRVTTVVIGWNGQLSFGERIFGSVLDRLLEASSEMVLVCRPTEPFNTSERVVLLLPPSAEFEPGFDEAVRATKRIAAEVGGDLLVLCQHGTEDNLEDRLSAIKPEVGITMEPLRAWDVVIAHLSELTEPNDLLILLGSRQGSLSWRPALNSMPRQLSQRFKDLNLVSIYPSERLETPTSGGRRGNKVVDLEELKPRIAGVEMNLEGSDLQTLGAALLERFLDDAARREAVTHKLVSASDTLSPEIRPGVTLLHARVDQIEEPVAVLGISREGIRLQGVANEVYVLGIVLSPIGTAQVDHVNSVAAFARTMRRDSMVEALREATSEDEVRLLLSDEKHLVPSN